MQLFVFKIGKIKLQNNNLENYFKKKLQPWISCKGLTKPCAENNTSVLESTIESINKSILIIT